MKMLKIIVMTGLLALVGCSSSDKEQPKLEERQHDSLQRDYIVTDASSNTRPGWIEDAQVWADQNSGQTDEYRYFSFETEPKVNRRVACNLAKANARADIAAEITTFIESSLVSTTEGSAAIDENNPSFQSMKEFTETTLVEKVQAIIYGSSVLKTYWEKRNYKQDRGAKRDYIAFTCGVYIQMERSRLREAIQRAADMVLNEAEDPAVKERAREVLSQAADNFDNLRKL